MLNSVRSRLTLLYVLIFGVLLGVFSLFLYALIHKDAHDRFDRSLTKAARTVANLFHHEMIENGYVETVATAHAIREYQQPNLFLAIFRDERFLDANHSQGGESTSVDKHPAAMAPGIFWLRPLPGAIRFLQRLRRRGGASGGWSLTRRVANPPSM